MKFLLRNGDVWRYRARMTAKVKRGLGLLVVALLGVLITSAGRTSDVPALEGVGWLVVAVGLIGGLALLAWGLLLD